MKTLRLTMDLHLDDLSQDEREAVASLMNMQADELDTLEGVTIDEVAKLLETHLGSSAGTNLIFEKSGSDAMAKIVGCVVQASEWV